MPRPVKPRKIGNHTAEDMKEALKNIKNGMSVRKSSQITGIPFTTLRRYYLKTRNLNLDETRLTPNYTINKVFTAEQENMLKDYFKYCALLFYGLSTKECRRIAYQMAQINNLKMPNSWKEKEMAGKDWLLCFRKRHPELTLRKPEPCSLARATAFNRTNVERFYSNLENLMKRNSAFADGTRIFNLDETSTTTVQKPQKVIAPKGRKNIGKVTSGERGTLVTTCCIISASGIALPPVMVFPRKNFKDFMIKNTPTGTLGLATPTGWMNCQIFPEVIKHFVKHTNTTPENPSILIMDNHESHLSLEALDIAKAAGVHILTLHPHTSGKLQPLDVGIYGPFKSFYNAGMDAWMLRNPGKPVTIYDIGEIIGTAFLKVMTPVNITKAFKACGIYPFDRNLFDDEDFLPSSVTDRPCPDCEPREEMSVIQPTQPAQASIDMPSPSSSLIQPAAPVGLSTSRRSSDSDVTLFEENTQSASNLPEKTMDDIPTLPSDNIIPLTRDTSPSIMQELNNDSDIPLKSITDSTLEQPPCTNQVSNYVTPKKTDTPHEEAKTLADISQPQPLIDQVSQKLRFETSAGSAVHLKTIENNLPSTTTISPFQFRPPIKAGPRKSTRKPRKLGRSLIATDTPEKLEIEKDKNMSKKRKEAKKRKITKKVLQSDSEEENQEPDTISYQESDEDNDWPDEEIEDDPVPITENCLKKPLHHVPQEGEYVLVEFNTKKSKVFYIGKVLESRNRKLEYYISFLRKKCAGKFHMPKEPDLSYVKENDVKLILPKPTVAGSTSRQQSIYSFAIDLSLLNVR